MAVVQQARVEEISLETLAHPEVMLRPIDSVFVKELSQSIKSFGLREHIHARQLPAGTRRIIDGVQRVEAVKLLGWKKIPAQIEREIDDLQEIELSLAHRNQRAELLNPWSEGKLYARLKAEKYRTVSMMSEATGKSFGYIQSRLRVFFSLNPSLVPKIGNGLSVSNAIALSYHTSGEQLVIVERILQDIKKRPRVQKEMHQCTCGDIHPKKLSVESAAPTT